FRSYEQRLLLTMKRKQTATLLPKTRRPLNVIHGSARFAKFNRARGNPRPDERTSLGVESCLLCRCRHSRQMGVLVADGSTPVYPTPSRNRRQRAGVPVLCRYLPHHILTCPRLTPNV